MTLRIEFEASEAVRAAVASLGRTEDIRFSPDNRRLALAGYQREQILVLGAEVSAGPAIALDGWAGLTCDAFVQVHGLDFLDDRTLVVANRQGGIAVVQLPPGPLDGRVHHVKALSFSAGAFPAKIRWPGSVRTRPLSGGRHEVLVANNYANRVSRHVADGPDFTLRRHRKLLSRGLDIPDGVATSHDGRWVAVTSHNTHDVKLYRRSMTLGPWTAPACELTGGRSPHGLCFTADDRALLVANAGGQTVSVYTRGSGWAGRRAAAAEFEAIDEVAFRRGRSNPEEGGPKGLDIDRSGAVVAATCQEQPLAFFDLAKVLGRAQESMQPVAARQSLTSAQEAG